jgi:acetyl esterase/lipase
LAWAVRHAVHRVRHPARRVRYGSHPDQWGELRLPPGAVRPPVAVLIHGGYWRPVWTADLMDALAIDLTGHGFATWNLEYRRPDPHGWHATTADVASGLEALAGLDAELGPVAVIGHSAGGQLAMRAAADSDRVALAVSLAGVLDLAEGQRRGTGNGAVAAALGGTPATVPDRYAASDPMARLPLGVPQLVVQGRDDDPDLVDCGRRYGRAARAAGDDVAYLERPGGHFAVIDPTTDLWHATAEQIRARLSTAG